MTVGPAASGKSTLLAALQRTGVVDRVVSTDAIRIEHGLDFAETTRTYGIAHGQVRRGLAAGEVVAVDATNVTVADRSLLRRVASPHPTIALRVGSGVTLDELIRRDAGRARHVPAHALAAKLAAFETEATREILRAEPFAAVIVAEDVATLTRCRDCRCPGVVTVGGPRPARATVSA
jgi:predicted kinase